MKQTDNNRLIRLAVMPLLPMVLFSCSEEMHLLRPNDEASGLRLELNATIDQQNDTRADESGFANGDRFGLFVVNYSGGEPDKLTLNDNQVNNVAITYNADANSWQSATDIYWSDPVTPADVYGYYPFYNGMSDVDAYNFEVKSDQSIVGTDGEMGSYEASDLLWAKTSKATPGKKVELTFSHIMAGVKVVLQQGSGFEGDAWTKLTKTVTVDNTVRTSEVDLSKGIVTPSGNFDRNIVMNPEGDAWRAVVVPQSVAADKTIIGITIDGKPYAYSRTDGMKYTAGKLHTFTIKIDRKGDSGDYALTLVNEDITPWEVDKSSHDFEANSYLTVHVAEAGTLKKCLEDMNLDVCSIRNLKVIGQLTEEDFIFIRENMYQLSAINLRECSVCGIYRYWENGCYEEVIRQNFLPEEALRNINSLRRVILPDNLKEIGRGSLRELTLTSTLVIPNCVTVIREWALAETSGSFSIILPNSLEEIEWCAFQGSEAQIDLKLPKSFKKIGPYAFYDCRNVHGTFSLPPNIEYIGEYAFGRCGTNLEGEIIIPQNMKTIPEGAFNSMGFEKPVKLTLHDGIEEIGIYTFSGLKFSEPIVFPSNLKSIGSQAFADCHFVGNIVLPSEINYIGNYAFGQSNVKGAIELPNSLDSYSGGFSSTMINSITLGDNVEVIAPNAFWNCTDLRYVKIGKNLSYIGKDAFSYCYGLETIVCLTSEPPLIDPSAFNDIDFNHCVVEVPEASVESYRRATGWKNFKSITPHHELSLSLSEISCLNESFSRSLIVRAEGQWEISEIPEWVHVTPDHADYKEEITVKIDALSQGSGNREGQIVFRLKDTGYTNYMTIRQYDYPELQDKEIVLQKASGNGNAIPIFIVGEGYGAESIVSGEYMNRVNETVESLFSIEPYKTYRELFTVSTAVSLSLDDGAQDIQTFKESKFGIIFPLISDWNANVLKSYAIDVSENIDEFNIDKTLIIVLSNYDAFSGSSYHDEYGDCVIACIGNSDGDYPYDNRGLVLNLAGGEALGGLASEQINHFEFIKGCTCPGCNGMNTYQNMKSRGLFENVTVSGKSEDAPWRDFIYHPKYSALVDMYEGGYNHLRGVWRSETESVMSNFVPYYNTISRYAIYKQIMKRAGLSPNLQEFIKNDKIENPN